MSRCRIIVRQSQRGFSLVEMVLGLAVFAMLTAVLQASLFSGRRMLASVEGRAGPAGDMMVARRVFESLIQGAVGDTATPFTGQPDVMSFVTVAEGLGRSGPAEVKFRIVSTDTGSRLVAERRMLRAGAAPESTILLDWQAPLAFQYALGRETQGLVWSDIVDGTRGVPSRVRLMAAAGPLMTARIIADIDRRCLLDTNGRDVQEAGACALR
jgi:prepilin-type N-terminal cleavage/methylation domain-containing protein